MVELDEALAVDVSRSESPFRYINHSCDPNTSMRIGDGWIRFYARRAIQRGEELTIDYGLSYHDGQLRCLCGVKRVPRRSLIALGRAILPLSQLRLLVNLLRAFSETRPAAPAIGATAQTTNSASRLYNLASLRAAPARPHSHPPPRHCRSLRATPPTSGRRYARLAIRNATIVDGSGTPASGPWDIIIENNRITAIVALDPVSLNRGARRLPADAEIDARGKYVLPGLINAHAHIQDSRDGIPQPLEYEFKTWLALGITTVRDVGSDLPQTLKLRAQSAAGEIVAPRIFVYPMFASSGSAVTAAPKNAAEARAAVRQVKQQGVDGIKLRQVHRDILDAVADEARALNLPIAHHVGVEETTAWDDIRDGVPLHRALVRHSRRCHSHAACPELSLGPASTTTTRPIASATPATSGAKPIPNAFRKSSPPW